MQAPLIGAIGVVIPARNEGDRIGACLASLRTALHELPPDVDHAVQVVLDRCTDDTEKVTRAALADWPQADCHVNLRRRPLGMLRHGGTARVLGRLGDHPRGRTWLLHTDADTTVGSDWAMRHLAHAREGAHAVAGLADLAEFARLPLPVARGYLALVSRHQHGGTHRHVYGANLGLRADAYLAVGGFAPLRCGEDRDIVNRLSERGYLVNYAADVRVSTSARVHGRAPGGLADVLAALHQQCGEQARAM